MSNVFEILIKLEFIKNYKMCGKFTILMSNVFVRSDCVTNEHILMKIIAFLDLKRVEELLNTIQYFR